MSEKNQAYLEIAKKVVSWIVILFTVAMIIFTIISVTTMDKNERTVFGNNFYIVRTDSMSLSDKNADQEVHFNAGDIVIIKALNNLKEKSELKEGDIIAFISRDDNTYGETITHRIRSVNKDRSGKVISYTTYGTNTDTNDETTVPPDFVIGTYNGKIPGVGNFFVFMKTHIGYVVCVLILFLLIIGYKLGRHRHHSERYAG